MKIYPLFALLLIMLQSCTDSKKEQADAFLHSGEQKIIAHDFAGAETDFTKAIALDPERYTPYHGRGEARLMLGKKQEGLADLKKAMELLEKSQDLSDPQYRAAYDGMKSQYMENGGK